MALTPFGRYLEQRQERRPARPRAIGRRTTRKGTRTPPKAGGGLFSWLWRAAPPHQQRARAERERRERRERERAAARDAKRETRQRAAAERAQAKHAREHERRETQARERQERRQQRLQEREQAKREAAAYRRQVADERAAQGRRKREDEDPELAVARSYFARNPDPDVAWLFGLVQRNPSRHSASALRTLGKRRRVLGDVLAIEYQRNDGTRWRHTSGDQGEGKPRLRGKAKLVGDARTGRVLIEGGPLRYQPETGFLSG